MKTILVAVFLLMTASVCMASSQTGLVKSLSTNARYELVYFELDGPRSAKPNCATQSFWIIKENSSMGKRQYAMLLAASVAGKQVRVDGMDACERWWGDEDVDQIQILP